MFYTVSFLSLISLFSNFFFVCYLLYLSLLSSQFLHSSSYPPAFWLKTSLTFPWGYRFWYCNDWKLPHSNKSHLLYHWSQCLESKSLLMYHLLLTHSLIQSISCSYHIHYLVAQEVILKSLPLRSLFNFSSNPSNTFAEHNFFFCLCCCYGYVQAITCPTSYSI